MNKIKNVSQIVLKNQKRNEEREVFKHNLQTWYRYLVQFIYGAPLEVAAGEK